MRIEDCIAMSEDGSWYAFPADVTRSQVISALAAESSWLEILRQFNVRKGYVYQGSQGGESWWFECEADDACAAPAWIAKARP